MMLIFNLTTDWTRSQGERKIRALRNIYYVRCEIVLSERGLCYITNNFLSSNLSAK